MTRAATARARRRGSASSADLERVHEALEHARHLLPSQAPIRVFVHHNTLHALQDLSFDDAVLRGAEIFGTEPYETEDAFARHIAGGRITAEDIAEVVAADGLSEEPIAPGCPSQRELRALRLEHPLERVEGAALRWLVTEGDALEAFHPGASERARERVLESAGRALGRAVGPREALTALYGCLAPHATTCEPRRDVRRARDRVLASHGVDVDRWVQPVLWRVCAAFVDQGVAYWSMPDREAGLYAAFRALFARPLGPPDPWMRGLGTSLRSDVAAEEAILEALDRLSIPRARWADAIEATLLASSGWAGMIAQLEERPDRAPVWAPPARLIDYLALALVLEAQAVTHVLRDQPAAPPAARVQREDETVYEAFVLAQLAGLGPSELDSVSAVALLREVRDFDSLARRRLWHLAYELRHRYDVLDGLLAHERAGLQDAVAPRVQAMFCIDEREESLRRHVEELDPAIETVGFAGFYGVPMAYRGMNDVKPTPLCPVVIRPRHLVVEEPLEGPEGERAKARLRTLGKLRFATDVGSKTLVRGGALTATLGLGAVLPLVARCLAPRFAEVVSHRLEATAVASPPTRLRIERPEGDDALEDGLLRGFTVNEMTDIVGDVLTVTGMAGRLAPLVVVVGHGSSSLNNPHEAAHDCGATGGGRGGPNARAFAAMANHPAVREALDARGLAIPERTWFVGAYHNTCDDAMDYYDVDLVPDLHRDELARTREAFERARRLDAHERCRRFESAPLGLTVERALAHVEGRAVDLGEPRPEYGHATNAVCIVGRRERTRGLFLDRRAFLVSYDPARDPDGAILGPLLASVGPVGAGINLEYYFSFVDPERYGSGTKLPHNIVGLIGVMNGHASDLRTGLPWQMVEIHEPVRMLTVVEAEPELLERLLERHPAVAEVVLNRWIRLAAWRPDDSEMFFFTPSGFVRHEPRARDIPTVETSLDHYRGRRGHLPCARIEAAIRTEIR